MKKSYPTKKLKKLPLSAKLYMGIALFIFLLFLGAMLSYYALVMVQKPMKDVLHTQHQVALCIYQMQQPQLSGVTPFPSFSYGHDSLCMLHPFSSVTFTTNLYRLEQLQSLQEHILQQTQHTLQQAPYQIVRLHLILVGVGVLFAFLCAYLVHHYYVMPVRSMQQSIHQYLHYKRYKPTPIHTQDELLQLRKSIDQLILQAQIDNPH